MHPGAWIAWVMMVMVMALATTNPFYLAILLLCVLLVAVLAPRTATGVAGFRALLAFGVAMLAVSVLVATINGNYGDHILFTIPGPSIPRWLGGLRLGGPVSAEGLAAAAIRGVTIVCIFLAFGVFNGAVSPHRVLRTTPAALFHASLVLTVGLTLLPSSIEDLRRIREIRALRGAKGGFRDLPALVVPAVINGLERSMQLAEAMEARGYAASTGGQSYSRLLAAASAPLFIFGAWLWFYTDAWKAVGLAFAVIAAACLGLWLWVSRKAHATTSFDDEPLPGVQRLMVLLSVAFAMAWIVLRGGGWSSLTYNPFAGLPMPGFSALGAFLVLATAWPAFLLVAFPEKQRQSSGEVARPEAAL